MARIGWGFDKIRQMISTEVSQILKEELSSVMDRITDRPIAKFEE